MNAQFVQYSTLTVLILTILASTAIIIKYLIQNDIKQPIIRYIVGLQFANLIGCAQRIAYYNTYPKDAINFLVQGIWIQIITIGICFVHLKTLEIFSILDTRITEKGIRLVFIIIITVYAIFIGTFVYQYYVESPLLAAVSISYVGPLCFI